MDSEGYFCFFFEEAFDSSLDNEESKLCLFLSLFDNQLKVLNFGGFAIFWDPTLSNGQIPFF